MEVKMLVNDKNKKTYDLYFILRAISILTLIAFMIFILYFYSYYGLDRLTDEMYAKKDILADYYFSGFSYMMIFTLIIYMIFMIVNYLLLKSKSKNVNKILIGEIIGVIVIVIIAIIGM